MYTKSTSAPQKRKTDVVIAGLSTINEFSGRRQRFLIRFCHWFNVVFLTVMAGSGLQILTAYPALGPRGEQYSWYPFRTWRRPLG
jgi:hypothetical protein